MAVTYSDGSTTSSEEVTVTQPVYPYYKILLLGDLAVGKSSISNRIAEDRFYENYVITIGKLILRPVKVAL